MGQDRQIGRIGMARAARPALRGRGFLLLEVIVALTVFSLVAVGLAVALHGAIGSAAFLEREDTVRRGLRSVMAEAQAMPKREEMVLTRQDEARGITFTTELVPVEFANREGQPVRGLYLLRARANYQEDGQEVEDVAEVTIYKP
jgi:hypothetical protein